LASLNASNMCKNIPTNTTCIALKVEKCTLDKLVEALEQDIKKIRIFNSNNNNNNT